MPRKFSHSVFSGEQQALRHIAIHHADIESSLRLFFSLQHPESKKRFQDYTEHEIHTELQARIQELERTSSLSLLTALEATLKIDFYRRCKEKKKDFISKKFREIFNHKKTESEKDLDVLKNISIERDILSTWYEYAKTHSGREICELIETLKGDYKYRHWLAHGRYWQPNQMGRQAYDYGTVYELVKAVFAHYPFTVPNMEI